MESYTQFWVGRPDPVHLDPGNPVFPEFFFSLFFALMDLLGPRDRPLVVSDGVRPPWDPPEAFEGPRGYFAFLTLKP